MTSPSTPGRRAPLLLALAASLALPLLATGGCGGAAGAPYREPATVEPEREDPAELESEQITLDEQLSDVMSRPDPDCERACELGDAICDLRDRICGIADRHPTDEQTARRCTDGSARCDAARERIAARCTCAAP